MVAGPGLLVAVRREDRRVERVGGVRHAERAEEQPDDRVPVDRVRDRLTHGHRVEWERRVVHPQRLDVPGVGVGERVGVVQTRLDGADRLGLRRRVDGVDLAALEGLELRRGVGEELEHDLPGLRLGSPVVRVRDEVDLDALVPVGDLERAARPAVPVLHRVVTVVPREDVAGEDPVDAAEELAPPGEGLGERHDGGVGVGVVDRRDAVVAGPVEDVRAVGDLVPGVAEVGRRDRRAVGPDRLRVDAVGHDLLAADGGERGRRSHEDARAVRPLAATRHDVEDAGHRLLLHREDAPARPRGLVDPVGAVRLLLGADDDLAARAAPQDTRAGRTGGRRREGHQSAHHQRNRAPSPAARVHVVVPS